MNVRTTRQAKNNAKALIRKVAEDSESLPMKGEADSDIAKDNPFVQRKNFISDYFGPPEVINIKQELSIEESLKCSWVVNENTGVQCGRRFMSPDDLIKHLLTDHSKWTVRGYVCHWRNCTLSYFNTTESFKEHLKIHVIIDPQPYYSDSGDDKVADGENAPHADRDPLYEKSSEEEDDTTDTDYIDSSEDESFPAKCNRKRGARKPPPAVLAKRVCRENSPKPEKKSAAPDPTDLSMIYYRFTCSWVVPFTRKGNTKLLTCLRRFSVLKESMNHLKNHHITKLKTQNQPLKCHWKECPEISKEFSSVDELVKHVQVHCEDKMYNLTNGATERLEEEGAKKNNPTKLTQHKSNPASSPRRSPDSSTRNSPSPVVSKPPVLERISSNPIGNSNEVSSEEKYSWMQAVLRALMSTRIKEGNHPLCPIIKLCHYCRFVSLKHRVMCSKDTTSFTPFEFTLFKNSSTAEDCESQYKFLGNLFKAIVTDEAVNHQESTFKNSFWYCQLGSDFAECQDHPLQNNTLINLFPLQYKKCLMCAGNVSEWPTETQENLLIQLGQSNDNAMNIQHEDILCIRGRVYNLTAVVSRVGGTEGKPSFHTRIKVKSMWIDYYGDHSDMINAMKVFEKKSARLVIYTAKKDLSELPAVIPKSFIHFYKYETCKGAVVPRSNVTSSSDPESTNHSSPDDARNSADHSQQKDDHEHSISMYAERRLRRNASESCINVVLQGLLQTGLTTILKQYCTQRMSCYFCKMLSFLRSVVNRRGDVPVNVDEFADCAKDFETDCEELDPGVSIGDVLREIISDERIHHGSSEAKYKFMIKLQKERCSCEINVESYHWSIHPSKKNEYLLDLMSKYETLCTQCNVMTTVQPIQMPENLLVTIEKNDKSANSVYFPEEWEMRDTRYYLASVITQDEAIGAKSKEYISYCKVFGKWFRYKDEKFSIVTSSEVLSNTQACVLVYVTEEISKETLLSVLNYKIAVPIKMESDF